MEFLDINLTKNSSIWLHAIQSSFYWWIFKENHTLLSGFTNPYKKHAKQENSSIFMNNIL